MCLYHRLSRDIRCMSIHRDYSHTRARYVSLLRGAFLRDDQVVARSNTSAIDDISRCTVLSRYTPTTHSCVTIRAVIDGTIRNSVSVAINVCTRTRIPEEARANLLETSRSLGDSELSWVIRMIDKRSARGKGYCMTRLESRSLRWESKSGIKAVVVFWKSYII